MSNDEDILKELKKLNKIMTLSNGPNLEAKIEKYATSNNRKKIWVLIDGKKQSDEIAKNIGLTKSAVDIFLKILEDAILVERQFNKPPTRVLDYVPAKWVEILQTESKTIQTEIPAQSSSQDTSQKSEVVPNG